MSLIQVVALAIVQGFAELLPISSSAHVVVAEKLMGLDPSAPPLTLLLVLLHTGTMFAVIVYFWAEWRRSYFASLEAFKRIFWPIVIATALTGVVGYGLAKIVVRLYLRSTPNAPVEQLFGHLGLIAPALFAVGVLIIAAYLLDRRVAKSQQLSVRQSVVIGIVQGVCLPFRGFSRSGATISAGMLAGVQRSAAEAFSFALAVVLTPPADAREIWRLYQSQHHHLAGMLPAVMPSILGVIFAFLAGLLALKWLSRWLETGRWHFFGIYCLAAALAVGYLYHTGF